MSVPLWSAGLPGVRPRDDTGTVILDIPEEFIPEIRERLRIFRRDHFVETPEVEAEQEARFGRAFDLNITALERDALGPRIMFAAPVEPVQTRALNENEKDFLRQAFVDSRGDPEKQNRINRILAASGDQIPVRFGEGFQAGSVFGRAGSIFGREEPTVIPMEE